MKMRKGFITIATGSKHYYKIAANLLLSYRYFTKNPLPFAIIAEEENEYTALFDDVIITNEAKRSFLDKFLLLKLCPYDETIFIDADSLAFGDLNALWEQFADATDFSALGQTCAVDDNKIAWYNVEDIGEYGKNLPYKCRVHAGVMFFRRSSKLENIYNDCLRIYSDYNKLKFKNAKCIDECIFSVVMPMHNMVTTDEQIDLLAFVPCLEYIKADMYSGIVKCKAVWGSETQTGKLVHYTTRYTHEALYRFNEEQLKLLLKYPEKEKITFGKKVLYKYKWRLFFLKIECWFKRTWKINVRRLKKLLGIKK